MVSPTVRAPSPLPDGQVLDVLMAVGSNSGGSAFVPIMQAADLRYFDHAPDLRRLDGSRLRRIFRQR